MRYFNLAILLLIVNLCYCQAPVASNGVNTIGAISAYGSGVWSQANNNSVNEIKGTPYLFDNWNTDCIIITKDRKRYRLAQGNYDAKLDQIVARVSNDSIFYFNPSGIGGVIINNRRFERYLDPELGRNSFYEVIAVADDLKILKRFTKVIKEGNFNPMTQKKQTPDSYMLDEKYFVKKDDSIEELILRKNKVIEIFGEMESTIKDYIKSNNLSVKHDQDLKKNIFLLSIYLGEC